VNETRTLARFVAVTRFADLPGRLVDHLKIAVLDAIGAGQGRAVQPVHLAGRLREVPALHGANHRGVPGHRAHRRRRAPREGGRRGGGRRAHRRLIVSVAVFFVPLTDAEIVTVALGAVGTVDTVNAAVS
jgi:hypothetical protein